MKLGTILTGIITLLIIGLLLAGTGCAEQPAEVTEEDWNNAACSAVFSIWADAAPVEGKPDKIERERRNIGIQYARKIANKDFALGAIYSVKAHYAVETISRKEVDATLRGCLRECFETNCRFLYHTELDRITPDVTKNFMRPSDLWALLK